MEGRRSTVVCRAPLLILSLYQFFLRSLPLVFHVLLLVHSDLQLHLVVIFVGWVRLEPQSGLAGVGEHLVELELGWLEWGWGNIW